MDYILHSKLVERLYEARIDARPLPRDFINDLIVLTRNGVYPEGWGSHGKGIQTRAETEEIHRNLATMTATPDHVGDSGFKFGRKSEAELVGVKPELVTMARVALQYSSQDFMIFDGLRTPEEQAEYVRKGMSRTLNSKHLKQADGFSHAIDCVPVVGTIPKWDWKLIYPVVRAVDRAATALGIADQIRWGGAWDRTLADFGGDELAYQREVEAYANRHPGKDFLDGPHFEWVN